MLVQFLHPGGYVERPDGHKREAALLAPGEEFDVVPAGLVAGGSDERRHYSDGMHVTSELTLLAAIGIDGEGAKHPLGLLEGATENAAVVRSPLWLFWASCLCRASCLCWASRLYRAGLRRAAALVVGTATTAMVGLGTTAAVVGASPLVKGMPSWAGAMAADRLHSPRISRR
jgi:hypothetical protein